MRHVISNLESWATGTSRGLSTAGPRSYADDLSWRYSHRGRDATTALVADCCLVLGGGGLDRLSTAWASFTHRFLDFEA